MKSATGVSWPVSLLSASVTPLPKNCLTVLDLEALLTTCPIPFQAHRFVSFGDEPELQAISIWPDPGAVAYTPEAGWEPLGLHVHVRYGHEEPEVEDPILNDVMGWSVALGPLLATIPDAISDVVTDHHNGPCWALLVLLHDMPEMLAVARDNPTLAGILALDCLRPRDGLERRNRLQKALRKPRVHLLPLVGLPPRKDLLRILARLEPWVLCLPGPQDVLRLLRIVDGTALKWLRHLPVIRADIVTLMLSPPLLPLCTFELLSDSDHCISWGLEAYLATCLRGRAEGWAPPTPARFTSRKELLDYRFALPPWDERAWKAEEFPEEFPVPCGGTALSGKPEVIVVPVTTAADMRRFALDDHLCIAMQRKFPDQAAQGMAAMYVARWGTEEAPAHATVWLRHRCHGWTLEQAALPRNETPGPWLMQRLEGWVDLLNGEEADSPSTPLPRASAALPAPGRSVLPDGRAQPDVRVGEPGKAEGPGVG